VEDKSGAQRPKSSAHPDVRPAHPDVRLARIAARQHSVVGRRQLLAIGISDSAIKTRVAQGRLHRVHHGVYAVGHPRLTDEGRWMTAVVACGQGTFLSHLDAAALWKIYDGTGSRVHVTVGWHREVEGLWVHRTRRLHPDDVTVRNGIPVTTGTRTLVDLTDLLSPDRVRRAAREAEFLGLLDLDALSAAVDRAHGRRRLRVLKDLIAAHRPGQIIRDELEHRFFELVDNAGLALPDTNVPIRARGKRYVIDCLWPEHRLAVELDGRDAHARTLAFESDRRKDSAITAIGLRVLRFSWYRVVYEPTDLLAELAETLKRTSSRGA
jgi:Transcriptional regulator, AbiEi antitoxin/Protein of unknown function (DUF559)